MKKVVFYTEVGPVDVGSKCLIVPVNHEQKHLNGQVARTSIVESYDPATGIVETQNTIYKPSIILG